MLPGCFRQLAVTRVRLSDDGCVCRLLAARPFYLPTMLPTLSHILHMLMLAYTINTGVACRSHTRAFDANGQCLYLIHGQPYSCSLYY